MYGYAVDLAQKFFQTRSNKGWEVSDVKLKLIIATALTAFATTSASAAVFPFGGSFNDGSVFSGSLDIDTTTGRTVSGNVLSTGALAFNFNTIAAQFAGGYTSTGYAVNLRDTARQHDLNFSIRGVNNTSSIVGLQTLSLEFGGVFNLRTSQTIAGISTFNTSQAVPEPATWALLIVSFALVGDAMRRRVKPSVSLA